MAHLKNRSNDYAKYLGDLFDKTPKAVLAAVVVSEQCGRLGISMEQAQARLLGEWWMLHWNGIVPQRPPGLEPEENVDI